jgi:hypothetical protein
LFFLVGILGSFFGASVCWWARGWKQTFSDCNEILLHNIYSTISLRCPWYDGRSCKQAHLNP